MSRQKSKESGSTLPKPVVTNATASSDVNSPTQRIIQNFLLIWVDASIDELNKDCLSMPPCFIETDGFKRL
jgi:hypothetical protein